MTSTKLVTDSIRQRFQRFTAHRLAMGGAIVLLLVVFAAIAAPLVSPYDPADTDPTMRLAPPGAIGHLLGTDGHGRDVLSRLIWGGRVSLASAVIPVAAALMIAIPLGLIGGYFSTWWAHVLMRTLDIGFAFPMVLLGVAIAGVLGPGMLNVMLSMVIVLVPYIARVIATEVERVKHNEYVVAARAFGRGDLGVLRYEIFPNVVSPAIVYGATVCGAMVVFGAGFSFLGLGIQPPTPDWGIMTSEGRSVLLEAPHVAIIPGALIVLVSVAFNFIGDGLRDALDPRAVRR